MSKLVRNKRLVAIWMTVMMVLSLAGIPVNGEGRAYADAASGTSVTVSVYEAVYEAGNQIIRGGVDSDWEAMGLGRAGREIPASYVSKLTDQVTKANGTYSRVTDYARTSLAITGIGLRATEFAGYNLIEKIYTSTNMTNQGNNGPIYSLLALDAGQYTIPAGAAWDREKLVNEIVSKQNADGGYGLGAGKSDPDMTAVALTALSRYTDKAEVKTAGDRAVEWLAVNQNAKGGYASWGTENSESVSQAIIGLTSYGIDPTSDRFKKNGISLLDNLISYRQSDGGFAHTLSGKTNGMATEQAYMALIAYDLFTKGEGGFYTFVPASSPEPEPATPVQAHIQVEGPQGTIAGGETEALTALEGLENVLTADQIPYVVDNTAYGPYLSSVSGINAGQYGGWDGWMFAVQRGSGWIYPSVGMSEFSLEEADKVVVYYGDSDTQFIHSVQSNPAVPQENQSFTLQVSKETLNWVSGQVDITPAANVVVTVGGTSVTTDAQGNAAFAAGLAAGSYDGTVTAYRANQSPAVVAGKFKLTVTENPVTPPVGGGNSGNSGGGGGGTPVPSVVSVTLSVTGDSGTGTILPSQTVELLANDHVSDVLLRQIGSLVQYVGSGPTFYVQAIDGLGEFDRGPLSGWMYSVNGTFPQVSAGDYPLSSGDVIAWRYTTDGGKDIGAGDWTSKPPAGGGGGAPGGASVPSEMTDISKQIDAVGLSPDNKQPIGQVRQAASVQNASQMMSPASAEQLRKELAVNKVNLSQQMSASGQATMSDQAGEISLLVPSGSLATTLTLTAQKIESSRPELLSGLYEFGPANTRFESPVYLSIKVPVHEANVNQLALVWLDEVANQWIPVPAVVDARTGIVTGKVAHFTKFAVIDRSKLAVAPTTPENPVTEPANKYSDDAQISSWARSHVYQARQLKLMDGVADDVFAPQESMTRAQLAAILVRLLKDAGTSKLPAASNNVTSFLDVSPGSWYADIIKQANEMGIVQGVTDTLFMPDAPVNRQDMAIMIARAYGLQDQASKAAFADETEIRSDAASSVNAVAAAGIMEGYNDRFYPEGTVNREMAAVVAVRLYEKALK
ncbi:S-layer homology domain-containing protein [Paenibacillus sp. FJAT-26967]|uniref:S-layer homology domain-containing protein n=1 Tax=Paenibacillus sp. FJAT-26967 TaxID=1729690 RepID=UPI000837F115|nr:S-layer homology domain-containing protein [Paenibacillus sp. FJAT-26967]